MDFSIEAISYFIIQWISAVLGETIPKGDFEVVLKDGTILCRLMNKIQPGSVKKYKESVSCKYCSKSVNCLISMSALCLQGTPFMLMENIQAFLVAAKNYGVPSEELFQTADLFEREGFNFLYKKR